MAESPVSDSDRIIEIFQQRWLDNDPISIEQLVERHNLADAQTIVDLVYCEVLLREEQNEQPQQDEYVRRFPALDDLIARQFQVHRALKSTQQSVDQSDAETHSGPSGPRIPGFELIEVIGRGGRGVVWKAFDEKLERTVAIKLLTGAGENDASAASLKREAESIASLTHPSIVRVYQVGDVGGLAYLVMEYVGGGSLAKKLQSGPLPVDAAVKMVADIAEAIQYAHQNGVIHRDIKPGNVLLDSNGAPRICDFGLARRLDATHSLHATGDVIGTPAYMPPEQAQGSRVDEQADVYALGAVLYESLVGRPPFQASTPWEILHQVIMNDPVPLRQLNPAIAIDLETICQRCLEKKPQRRYPSAGAVVDELDRFRRGEPIEARPLGMLQRVSKWCGRNRRLAALAVTSIVLLLFLGVGSTIAAIWYSSTNKIISAQRQQALNDAEELAEANKKVEVEKNKAINDRSVAIKSIATLSESLFEDLKADAANIKTREKVLVAAINGLESITQIRGDIDSDRTAMRAYWRIAELESLRGETEKANDRLGVAIELARSMVQRLPHNRDAKFDLIRGLDQQLLQNSRTGNLANSSPLMAEIEQILKLLIKQDPSDAIAWRQQVELSTRRLDYLWFQQDSVGAIKFGDAAIQDLQQLMRLIEPDIELLDSAIDIHSRLGRAYFESGDSANTKIHFEQARRYVDQALELAPNSPNLQIQDAINSRMTGVLLTSLTRFDEACDSFQRAKQIFETLSEADPENFQNRLNIANTQLLMVKALWGLGERANAIKCLREAMERIEGLITPTSVTEYLLALYQQANIDLGLYVLATKNWQQAGAYFDRAIEIGRVEAPRAGFDGPATKVRVETATLLRGCVARLAGESTPPATNSNQAMALMLVPRMDAQRAESNRLSNEAQAQVKRIVPDLQVENFDELFAHVATLSDVQPVVAMFLEQCHARGLSLRAEHLSQSNTAAKRDQSKALIENAVSLLKTIAEKYPQAINELIYLEPDLIWLRQTEQFKASGIKRQGAN